MLLALTDTRRRCCRPASGGRRSVPAAGGRPEVHSSSSRSARSWVRRAKEARAQGWLAGCAAAHPSCRCSRVSAVSCGVGSRAAGRRAGTWGAACGVHWRPRNNVGVHRHGWHAAPAPQRPPTCATVSRNGWLHSEQKQTRQRSWARRASAPSVPGASCSGGPPRLSSVSEVREVSAGRRAATSGGSAASALQLSARSAPGCSSAT